MTCNCSLRLDVIFLTWNRQSSLAHAAHNTYILLVILISAVVTMCICSTGTRDKHPFLAQAMILAKNSVMESSQKSYQSTWNKWEIFLHKYFPPVWTDTHYNNIDYTTLLDRLLMFVTYLAHELRCNVRSIPSKMSALRHGMVSRLVKCCNAFDNDLLQETFVMVLVFQYGFQLMTTIIYLYRLSS